MVHPCDAWKSPGVHAPPRHVLQGMTHWLQKQAFTTGRASTHRIPGAIHHIRRDNQNNRTRHSGKHLGDLAGHHLAPQRHLESSKPAPFAVGIEDGILDSTLPSALYRAEAGCGEPSGFRADPMTVGPARSHGILECKGNQIPTRRYRDEDRPWCGFKSQQPDPGFSENTGQPCFR